MWHSIGKKIVASIAAFQMSDGSVTILNLHGENSHGKNRKLQKTGWAILTDALQEN